RTWSGSRRSARIPACTLGCRVFTRPSRHSGNPVSSSTAVTGTPAAAIRAAVEPVETIATPAACSPRASSSSPVLSYTDTNARPTRLRSLITALPPSTRPGRCGRARALPGSARALSAERHRPLVHRPPGAHHPADHLDEQGALGDLDPLVQGRLVVARLHPDRLLGDHRAGVGAGVHQHH